MLKLRACFSKNPRIYPLMEGVVQAKDIELDVDLEDHGDTFAWLLDGGPCDVFEFSISHYMTTFERDNPMWNWTAIPIFLAKATPFLETRVNTNAEVETLPDLRGKRVGMGDFAMTAAVWLRVALDQIYGVRPSEVSWFAGRARRRSHDFQLGIQDTLRPDLSVTWLDEDGALDRLLRAGDLDAAFGVKEDPAVRPLFPDGGAGLFAEFYRTKGYVPVNHIVLVRKQVVEENPWVPETLFDAFEKSKHAAYERDPSTRLVLPNQDAEAQRALYGADPYPSGVTANRAMLDGVAQQSYEEGLTKGLLDVDKLFWESVRGT
jgi:4,5-dihydroxyphthalate decarboxylase